jgi:hypothetical protein
MLDLVGSADLVATWPDCVYWLTLGSAQADYGVEDLRRYVFSGGAYLFVARELAGRVRGAAVVSMHKESKRTAAHIMALGGKGVCTQWVLDALRGMLKQRGADVVRCWAKPAQARLYRRFGMQEVATVMEMES